MRINCRLVLLSIVAVMSPELSRAAEWRQERVLGARPEQSGWLVQLLKLQAAPDTPIAPCALTTAFAEPGRIDGFFRVSTDGKIIHYALGTVPPYKLGNGPATLLAYGVPLPQGTKVSRSVDRDVQLGYNYYALSELATEIKNPGQVKRLVGVLVSPGAPVHLAIQSGTTNWGRELTPASAMQMKECLGRMMLFD